MQVSHMLLLYCIQFILLLLVDIALSTDNSVRLNIHQETPFTTPSFTYKHSSVILGVALPWQVGNRKITVLKIPIYTTKSILSFKFFFS